VASKRSSSEYYPWIHRFLHIFVGEFYLYTTPLAWLHATNKTTAPHNIYLQFNYSTPFDIPCIAPLRAIYGRQWLIDPERHIHPGPDVYAIWNGKICLLREVSDLHPTAIIFWIDIGSARESFYDDIQFPDAQRIESVVTSELNGSMIFAMHHPWRFIRDLPVSLKQQDYVIGTFFGGDRLALQNYSKAFWTMHNYFLREGQFVGKDQNIMSAYVTYADKAWIQPNYEARGCDSWFSTFSFYSDVQICFSNPPVFHLNRLHWDNRVPLHFSFSQWLADHSS
jgi:hypothetical protein